MAPASRQLCSAPLGAPPYIQFILLLMIPLITQLYSTQLVLFNFPNAIMDLHSKMAAMVSRFEEENNTGPNYPTPTSALHGPIIGVSELLPRMQALEELRREVCRLEIIRDSIQVSLIMTDDAGDESPKLVSIDAALTQAYTNYCKTIFQPMINNMVRLPQEIRDMIYNYLDPFSYSISSSNPNTRYLLKHRVSFYTSHHLGWAAAFRAGIYFLDPAILGDHLSLQILKFAYARSNFEINVRGIKEFLKHGFTSRDIKPALLVRRLVIQLSPDDYRPRTPSADDILANLECLMNLQQSCVIDFEINTRPSIWVSGPVSYHELIRENDDAGGAIGTLWNGSAGDRIFDMVVMLIMPIMLKLNHKGHTVRLCDR
ncbi:hypothetical protein FB567DRAFT_597385 [Paraphoma chrysanthemicola]|uniref:Uncharacterized protein n=1 Tax=Paraphoma chrysanthemicola TaxID=798071 RepID=A0A8K0VTK5_9PLEO|nr:hypothetical protein FB567DRAFT_597385 [Paraphoma chrysanthemicola]